MSNILVPGVIGSPLSGTDYNSNLNIIEASFADVGPYVVSGLVPSAGAGLAVSVTAGNALIGANIAVAAPFNIGGLAPSVTNWLWLLQNGAGTSTTTSTPPANSVLLGTCLTGVATVTSVDITRASGRQQFVQPQNLVHGGPAGNPRTVHLNSWNATDGAGFEVSGSLPSGALPGNVAYTDAANIFTNTAGNTFSVTDAGTSNCATVVTLRHDSSGAPAAGFGTMITWINKNSTGLFPVTGQIKNFYTDPTNAAEKSRTSHFIIYNGTATEVFAARAVGMLPAGGVGGELFCEGDFRHAGTNLGFYNAVTVPKPTVSGVKGGGTALVSLIAQLVALGLITDTTT